MVEKDSALIAYIFGIISIVMAVITPFAGLIFGIIGLVQSKKQKNDLSKSARKLNLIGVILSAVLFVIVMTLQVLEILGTIDLSTLPVA